jgi:hypothetical protein
VTPVYVELHTSLGVKVLALGDEYMVDPCVELLNAIRMVLGETSVSATAGPRPSWERVAFIDETYNSTAFWICCIVLDTDVLEALQADLRLISVEAGHAWNLAGVPELHGYELFHRCGGFRGVPARACVGIYRSALEVLVAASPDIVLRGVVTERIRHQHPHRLAWRWAIESVDELPGAGGILVVADRRIEMEKPLQRDVQDYIRFGTGGWKPRKIERVLPDLRFQDSHENPLLQAADLVAFLHQRRVSRRIEQDSRSHSAREALWELIAPHVRVERVWDPPLSHGEPPEEAPGWAA